MIATVSYVTIDLSRLEAIGLDYRDEKCLVLLTLKPTLQYVQNPETGEWELHHANTVVEQVSYDSEVQMAKYDHWVSLWEKYKEQQKNEDNGKGND